VFTVMDMVPGILGRLWGAGGQQHTGPPCLWVHGLSVHDETISGLRVCLISYGERGKHGMLLKAIVLPRRLLNPARGS
jgi:hypothetical protein